MPHIQQLDSHVADLIAAGEVVERPASVVKELVENAIDAGAAAVAVEVRNGGMRLIRVTDNGCGIAPQELPTAFLRHATSKLRSEEDLGRIGTLGFRGEALAAISAVSRLDISTCQRESEGAALHLEGGVPEAVTPTGTPEGTTIFVRDLFYNTPARLKFMRKDTAETAAVNGLMQHLALSHPEVSFKFIKDDVEALHTPGDGKLESAVYAALGRDFAHDLTKVEGRSGEIAVSGFVTKPLRGRGSRGMQMFFVNGRFIKSQLLTAALEEGYRNQIMKGRFPGCVLMISMPVTALDVNVHPAKTQVKFAREKEVFDTVYHTVLDALAADGAPQPAATRPAEVVNPRQDFYQSMDAKTFREQAAKPTETVSQPLKQTLRPAAQPAGRGISVAGPAHDGWDTEQETPARVSDSHLPTVEYERSRPVERIPLPRTEESVPAVLRTVKPGAEIQTGKTAPMAADTSDSAFKGGAAAPAAEGERSAPAMPRTFVPAIPLEQLQLPIPEQAAPERETVWRIAGEVLNTYIVCEDSDQNVWLIDKHAAHERINFDRLMAAKEPPMRQTLLQPAAVELEREAGALLLDNLPLLETLGFFCEDFGGGTVLVREVPADLDAEDAAATLEELAEDLRKGRNPEERREALLHTMSCKAAIKAGMHSDERELRVLVDRVQSGEIQYCPHGRPVKVKLSRYELEKMFKRA